MRFAVLALSVLALCQALTAVEPHVAGEVRIKEHSLKTRSGEVISYELGILYVPENRNDPSSRVIGIGFARILAKTKRPGVPPVFRLPGGPGSSLLTRLFHARGDALENWLPITASLMQSSDVLIVDQRGYTQYGDSFKHTFRQAAKHLGQATTIGDRVSAYQAFARETVADYANGGIDLRGYTVKECAHDVADLSEALGYGKIVLCGSSFGSQWSFAVMRQHPDLVARALLTGVEPLDHGYDMPSHVFAAVQRMWRVVDQDKRFEPYLPEGGMSEAAESVIRRLEESPIQLETDGSDGKGRSPAGMICADDFPWHDPTMILELYHGQTARWRIDDEEARSPSTQEIRLIQPLIDTSLGVSPQRRHRLLTDPANRYLRQRNFARYFATEEVWPSLDVGNEFRTPVLSEIPVLFAQGNWDTNTPIENTLEIAPFFPNSRVLIADRGGHGVLVPILREHPIVWDEIAEFVQTGDQKGIPVTVRLRPSRGFSPPTFKIPST